MSEPFTFSVWGTPRSKSRPRFVKGKVVSTASPKEKLWKKAVERIAFCAAVYRGDPMPLFKGPVSVRMVFTFRPPASALDRIGTPHTHKPDKDNLEKLVLDAMTRAGVFNDDGQAAGGETTKLWGERSGVVVLVEEIEPSGSLSAGARDDAAPDWLTASRG